MEQVHPFRVVAWWASGRSGIAKSTSAPNAIHFTAPPAFGGLDGRWTPEDLLLGAIASCYTTTFRTIAENSQLEYTDLQVEVEAAISRAEAGYRIGPVLIRVNLTVPQQAEQARALKLLHKAEGLCIVARALSVEKRFEPNVQVCATGANANQELTVSDHVDGRQGGTKPQ